MALAEIATALPCKRLTEFAQLPKRGSELAAGYDLYAAYDMLIEPHGKGISKTDIAMAIPPGYYGRVAPRSGLAVKHHIDVGAGVIDADYRGNVGVVLFNHGDAEFKITKGDRVAQLILEKIITPAVVEVEDLDELGTTARGAGGYGSTGVNENEQPAKKQMTEKTAPTAAN